MRLSRQQKVLLAKGEERRGVVTFHDAAELYASEQAARTGLKRLVEHGLVEFGDAPGWFRII